MFRNKILLPAWKGRSFITNSCLLADVNNFQDKPKWLKKFKIKQASFQKDDNLPIFLKKGFKDKLLYNVTWIGCLGGVIYSTYSLHVVDVLFK